MAIVSPPRPSGPPDVEPAPRTGRASPPATVVACVPGSRPGTS